jgi:hypothetical protein
MNHDGHAFMFTTKDRGFTNFFSFDFELMRASDKKYTRQQTVLHQFSLNNILCKTVKLNQKL